MGSAIIGGLISTLGVAVFILVFFRAVPYITSLIPNTEWSGIINLMVYLVVAYIGGITVPLSLFIFGIMVMAGHLND